MRLSTTLCGVVFLGVSFVSDAQDLGVIGESKEDGQTVIYRFVDEYPSSEIRTTYSWLTVISWKYDGSSRSGMPPDDINQNMIALEDAIEESLEDKGLSRHAYSRTGNNLKEFAYYISDRDEWIDAFNKALAGHPRYPIEINFYKDQQWQDFQSILKLFNRNG